MDNDLKLAPIRPYTLKELRMLYNVSWMTMQKWLKMIEKEVGPKTGHFYSKKQVEVIFELLGHPEVE